METKITIKTLLPKINELVSKRDSTTEQSGQDLVNALLKLGTGKVLAEALAMKIVAMDNELSFYNNHR